MNNNVSFNNSGSMYAGSVNQVGGNQYNWSAPPELMRRTAASLRCSVERKVRLDQRRAEAARAELDEIQAGLGQSEPQARRVATALKRLTELLKEAGALVSAGAALLEPLRRLAIWLGALGAPVLALL